LNKILILGSSGAGKSTLAKRLGKSLNINVLHLDTIFWEKNWQVRDKESYLLDLQKWLSCNQYIIDGNHDHGSSLKIRIENADTIFFLNYNRFYCLLGALKRYFKFKNKTRPSMTEGCNEKIDFEFVKYILYDYPNKKKKIILSLIEKDFNGKFIQFKNRKSLTKFIKELGELK